LGTQRVSSECKKHGRNGRKRPGKKEEKSIADPGDQSVEFRCRRDERDGVGRIASVKRAHPIRKKGRLGWRESLYQ
jgi:hypothetical protein